MPHFELILIDRSAKPPNIISSLNLVLDIFRVETQADPDSCSLDDSKMNVDISIITPPTYTKNGCKYCTITIYILGMYKEDQVSANDESWCNAV